MSSSAGEHPGTAHVEIVATEHASSFVVRMGGRDQSYVDLADPTRLVFDYVRRMGDVVDAMAAPRAPVRVVHVGGAGLSLARYVAATRPGSAQVVLEPDAALTTRVRAELPLVRRSGIKVRPVDGVTGVGALRDAYAELVIVDAYADGEVPRDLLTPAFLGDVDRVLEFGGLLLLNLADRAPFPVARRVVAGIRGVFDHVVISAEPATLRGRRAGNLLLVAGNDGVPLAALSRSAVSSAAPYRVLAQGQVSDFFGGGSAF